MTNYTTSTPGWADYFIAGLSGALIALVFPDYGIWPLAWFGLCPLMAILPGKAPHMGARLGFVAGLFYFGPTVSWMSNSMTTYGHMISPLAWLVTAMATCYLSVFTALFGYAVSWISRSKGVGMALAGAPFIWAALEHLRGIIPPLQFPWARLADSQFTVLHLIQVADLVGEEGLSILIVFVNTALVKLVFWVRSRGAPDNVFPLAWTALALALVTATLGYGSWRLNQPTNSNAGKKEVSVALIQGNIDQARKWEKAYRDEQLKIYFAASRSAVDKGAQIVIWPEASAPFYFGSEISRDSLILDLSRSISTPILFGAPGIGQKDGQRMFHNRAWLVRPDGYMRAYDKIRLVPFGEYIPMKKLLSFIGKIVPTVGDMAPGEKLSLMNLGGYNLGVQICFEITFPEDSRKLASMGAGAIATITNDSWFGRSGASSQALAMAVFRAVENRIPVLRSAQSGISAIISPTGEITGQTKLFVKTTLMGKFAPRHGPVTPYTRFGSLLTWMIIAVATGFLIPARFYKWPARKET